MEFPGDNSWQFYDVDAYRRAREAVGAPLPEATPQAPSGRPAAGADDLLGQLAGLQLGRAERHRASDAGASLAPRGAAPGIGGSMRLPASAAASLVKREPDIHSARYDLPYLPEYPQASPEPYTHHEPARHSIAHAPYAAHAADFDEKPPRKGGFKSALKQGFKGFKSALGLGSSNSSRSSKGSWGAPPARPGIDASMRRDTISRMDAPSPGQGVPRQAPADEALDAQVTQHDSPPAEAPMPPQPPRASRRRPRDEEWESARRLAGSAMHAQATTLPRPEPARRRDLYEQDRPLIDRARAGLAANPDIPQKTRNADEHALVWLSAWFKQIGKPPMEGRLFTKELTLDAWKFARLGGRRSAPTALRHLRDMETSSTGMAQIPRQPNRRDRDVPQADRERIEAAFAGFGAKSNNRRAALAFSEWLAREELPALTDQTVGDDGTLTPVIHTEDMTHFAEAYKLSPGAQYANNVMGVLKHLRIFDTTGAADIQRRSHHFGLPEADQRLVNRYRETGNAQLLAQAHAKNVPMKYNHRGRTKVDEYASATRGFSDWLQQQGRPPIAARLHDESLMNDLELFAEPKSAKHYAVLRPLRAMKAMFPPEDPQVVIARLGRERLVNALGSFAPGASVAEMADRVGADVDDLLVFLDARADDGLTPAGHAMVQTLEGRLLQAANANIALRQQLMAAAAAQGGAAAARTPPSFVMPTPPSGGWSNFARFDDLAGPEPSVHHGTASIFGGLGSLDSDAHHGGFFPGPGTPSEVAQPARTDSAYAGLSSLGSVPFDAGASHYPGSPSEVAQPARTDSAYAGLSSLGSVPFDAGASHYPGSPSEVAQPARTDSAYAGLSSLGSVPFDAGASHYPGSPSEVAGPSRPHEVAPLPTGYVQLDLRTVLDQLGAEVGYASGQGMNCLLDSILQLARGARRDTAAMPALDHEVRLLRNMLVSLGLAQPSGLLDVFEPQSVGATLALNLGVRIQFIQQTGNGLFIPPEVGEQGPLVHILNTHGHFQPLWPSQP